MRRKKEERRDVGEKERKKEKIKYFFNERRERSLIKYYYFIKWLCTIARN